MSVMIAEYMSVMIAETKIVLNDGGLLMNW